MFSNKIFGSNRSILNDIANKIVSSSTQNLFLKPNQDVPFTKSQSSNNLDINRNEINDKHSECKILIDWTPKINADYLDRKDPFFVVEYIKDIMPFLFEQEKEFNLSRRFLDTNSHAAVESRTKLINSIVKKHAKFDLPQEVLFLTVQIFDRYVDSCQDREIDIVLLLAVSFFIAVKYESRSSTQITLKVICLMTDNKYTRSELRKMEVKILNTLNFHVSKPMALQFLRRFSKVAQVKYEEHTLAKYFLEICLLDYEFSMMKPSYLAASALCLTFKLLKRFEWDYVLEEHSSYKLVDLRHGMQNIAQMVLRVNQANYEYKESWKKFNEDKYLNLSSCSELSGVKIREIALGSF